MRSELDIYHPTVWRTCRALMNERRLACLSAVLESPGLSVGDVAEMAGVAENQSSINLRALQARGLIRARPDGRWMRYFPEPDPLVRHASAVLSAMRRELKNAGKRTPEQLVSTLRAFTHSRRLSILKRLTTQTEATCEEIVAKTHISRPAVGRHLETLRGAGLVSVTETGAWRLTARKEMSPLARALLAIVGNN